MMKNKVLFIFLFLVGNFILLALDRLAFQYQPFLGFIFSFFHLLGLIIFPYRKFLNK